MSILFNNGGGGTNPTNEYLPYNNNGSFADSPLFFKAGNALISRNPLTNNDEGINLDWYGQIFYFGDFNGNTKGFYISVNNIGEEIKTGTSTVDNGLQITNNFTFLGDYANNFNGSSLRIDDQNNTIYTTLQNDPQGFRINSNAEYYFGDFDGVHNGTFISVLDTVQTVEIAANTQIHSYTNDFYTQTNKLSYQEITAGSLIYTTAGGSSGKHLKIFVNGVGYKIALNNL